MNTAVIYTSQTGFTKRYAQWIAEATNADCLELSKAKTKNMDHYNTIIFGGWACAGGIKKLKWFKNNINKWANKKLIVFCVGGSPIDSPAIEPALKSNFTEAELKRVTVFYCPGGFNYEKMPILSKFMMAIFIKTLKAKKNKKKADKEMIKMISSSYDISNKKYIEPILDCINHKDMPY